MDDRTPFAIVIFSFIFFVVMLAVGSMITPNRAENVSSSNGENIEEPFSNSHNRAEIETGQSLRDHAQSDYDALMENMVTDTWFEWNNELGYYTLVNSVVPADNLLRLEEFGDGRDGDSCNVIRRRVIIGNMSLENYIFDEGCDVSYFRSDQFYSTDIERQLYEIYDRLNIR